MTIKNAQSQRKTYNKQYEFIFKAVKQQALWIIVTPLYNLTKMKLFSLVLFVFVAGFSLDAQVIVPLETSAVVADHYPNTRKAIMKAEAARNSAARGSSEACEAEEEIYFDTDTDILCTSGDSRQICFAPFDFPQLDSIACLNCDNLVSGTATINDFCVEYSAQAGIDLDLSDTLNIAIWNQSADTTVLSFPIIIKRPNQNQTLPSISIGTDSLLEFCLPTLDFPGAIVSYEFTGCQDEQLGTLGTEDSCFTYLSQRFAGQDTVCLEVCDEYCVCDIYSFPVDIEADIISLPFFDDFSYDGPYPAADLWLDDDIFVNYSLAYQPPSVGVATFDGTSETGQPYGGGYGAADQLTSAYLDLSGYAAADNVHLSFYLGPKGIGLQPTSNDPIILEFKASDGSWQEVASGVASGNYLSTEKVPLDSFYVIHISEADYLYEGFQFRFTNFCPRDGFKDLWHLDYVRLVSNEIPDGSIEDVAFTALPSNFLGNYSEMPWSQFKGFQSSELASTYDVSARNHFNLQTALVSTFYELTELTNNVSFVSGNTLVNTTNLPPNAAADITENLHSFNLSDAFPDDATDLEVQVRYEIEIGGEDTLAYPQFNQNNVVEKIVTFGTHLAYDDHSAETAVRLENANSKLAIEFDINKTEELQGIAVKFPQIKSGSSGLPFRVLVYENAIPSDPIYTSDEYETYYSYEFGLGIQDFVTYSLKNEAGVEESLTLSPGKYFLAIEKIESDSKIILGLDLNNDQFSDKQHLDLQGEGNWQLGGPSTPGALMLRGILGPNAPISTPVQTVDELESLVLFPNPANEVLQWNIRDENYSVQIYDLYGRNILTTDNVGALDISKYPNGSYYLQLTNAKNGENQVRIFQILR